MKIAYGAFCAPMVLGVVQWANTPLQFVVLLAAAVAALGILWTKGVKPVASFCVSAVEAIESLRGLHEYQREVLTRLEVIEGAMYGSGMMESLPIRRRDDPPYR